MGKLNREEYNILRDLEDDFKWVAGDKDGPLVMGAVYTLTENVLQYIQEQEGEI